MAWPLVLIGGLLAATARPAPAAPPTDPLVAARAAERRGDVGAERAACEAVVEADTDPRGVAACTRRLAWIAARADADGGFRTLEALQAARRAPPGDGLEAIRAQLEERLGADTANRTVRDDVAQWLARDALNRLDDPQRALRFSGPLWARHRGAPSPEARAAAGLHAQALARAGRLDEARAVEESRSGPRAVGPREGVRQVVADARRARLRQLSLLSLLGLAALALRPTLRGIRALRAGGARPMGLWPLGVTCVGATALAGLRDPGAVRALLELSAALAALHLIAAAALTGARSRLQRGLLRGAVAAATLGASALILDGAGLLTPLLP